MSSQKKFQRYRPKIEVQGFLLLHFLQGKSDIEVPFFLVWKWALLAKSDEKNWHFEWPNQNSKTTFIVQTFPKYGPYGFDLVNLSLLGPILAKFQFCWFSGLFWPFFPCKWGQTRKSFAWCQFLVYNAEIFFWTPTTHEPEWLRALSSIQKSVKMGHPTAHSWLLWRCFSFNPYIHHRHYRLQHHHLKTATSITLFITAI